MDSADGALFRLPPNARSAQTQNHCINAPVGWSTCPAGYAVYCRELQDLVGYRLVFYGLKVVGVSTCSGKSSSLSIRLNRQDMEKYVNEMLAAFDHIDDNVTYLINRGVHDVRHINADIKSAAEDLKFILQGYPVDLQRSDVQVGRIKAMAEILSARLDFLDYFANPSLATQAQVPIAVFKKVDKAKRVLASRAFERNVRLSLRGAGTAKVAGPRVFDVVPYIVIENAIKYSPSGETVEVEYGEKGADVVVAVRNIGPALDDREKESIFLPGYRGRRAVESDVRGTGLGIYFAKMVVERYLHGSITLTQLSDYKTLNGLDVCTTEVTLRLPVL